jgi:hypothetical protein
MFQLLLAENNRGWEAFNEDPKRIEQVTAEDVQRVAQTYFKPERRAVVTFHTKTNGPEESSEGALEGLSADERAQVARAKAMVAQMPADQVKEVLRKLDAEADSAPPEQRKMVDAMRELLRQRLAQGGQP